MKNLEVNKSEHLAGIWRKSTYQKQRRKN